MIARLKGVVWESRPLQIVVDVGGVGYVVGVPMTGDLPKSGLPIELFTHAVYREDAALLYGFLKREERDLFVTLVERVSGIGPKTALGLLAHLGAQRLRAAVEEGNVETLKAAPGVGKKTAERMVLEMKGLSTIEEGGSSGGIGTDAAAALVSLGFSQAEAQKAVAKALSKAPQAGADELIRLALKKD